MSDLTPIQVYSNYLREKKIEQNNPESPSLWANVNPLDILRNEKSSLSSDRFEISHGKSSNMSDIEFLSVASNPKSENKIRTNSQKDSFVDIDFIKGKLAGYNSKWQPPLPEIEELDSSDEISSIEEVHDDDKLVKQLTRQATKNFALQKKKSLKAKEDLESSSSDSFHEIENYLELSAQRSSKKKLSKKLQSQNNLTGFRSAQPRKKTDKADKEAAEEIAERIRLGSVSSFKKSILNPTRTLSLSLAESTSQIDDESLGLRLPWYLINPFGKKWKIWEYLTTLLLVYVMIFTPFKIAFIDDGLFPIWDIIDQVVNYIYMLDILFRFILPVYDDDEQDWKTTLWVIAKQYLKFWFWIDLVSVFPLDLIIDQGNLLILIRLSRLHKLYRLFKVARLARAAKAVRSQNNIWSYLLELLRLNPSVIRISMNSFAIIFFCHLFACLWYFMATIVEDKDSWVIRLEMQDRDIFDLYLLSLYWIVQTVITVGYGDVPAITVSERIIAICAMFAGVIFFSLTVGTLTSLLTDMDKKNKDYENKLTVLTQIKEEYKIGNETFDKVRLALKYGIFKGQEDFEELLTYIPNKYANELARILYAPKIEGVDFFDDLPDELIRRLGPHLKELTFEKGDKVYQRGDYAIEMFFVVTGSVSLVIPHHNNTPCMTVKQGGYFGEIELIYGTPRYFTYIADSHTTLMSLEKKEFVDSFFQNFVSIGTAMKDEADERLLRQRSVYNTICEIIATHVSDQARLSELGRNLKDVLDPNKKIGSEGRFIRRERSRSSLNTVNRSVVGTKKESLLDNVDKLYKVVTDGDNRIKALEDKVQQVMMLMGIVKPNKIKENVDSKGEILEIGTKTSIDSQ